MSTDSTTIGATITDPVEGDDETESSRTFDRPERRFAIGDELGRGAMGRVVAATDIALERDVAIKQVLSQRRSDVARFEREVRITARLEHPAIVPIHEAGRDDEGRPFYVMRRIAGQPFSERLQREASVEHRLALLPNLLAAVDAAAFAHARKVIHRDIKPANILIGDYGETLLIDWGLARSVDEPDEPSEPSEAPEGTLTRAGDVYGTPGYMSPEQARGERVDERTDVYALGATLFHLAAGKPPFGAKSAPERLALAALGEPAPLHEIGEQVPVELVAIIGKAMMVAPDQRYANAGGLAADLRAFLAGKLVAAHRYTPRERFARFVRRHRVAVAISTVAAIAIAVTGAIAVANVMTARDEAIESKELAMTSMHAATDQAELAILGEARAIARDNPTRAIALLKQLPADSAYLPRARDVASAAAAYGISSGFRAHVGAVRALAVSPDGSVIASAGDGDVVLIEVATGTPSRASVAANALAWSPDGKALIAATDTGIVRIDPRTTATSRLSADGASKLWLAEGDRVRYVDTRRDLVEVTLSSGARRVIAGDVDRVVADGTLAVITGKTTRIVDGDQVRTLDVPDTLVAFGVSRELDRIAGSQFGTVFEWDLSGREVRTWKLQFVSLLEYVEGQLYAVFADQVYALFDEGQWKMLTVAVSNPGVMKARSRQGVVFAFPEGTIVVGNQLSAASLGPIAAISQVSASPGSAIVATGHPNGLVRWWNVAHVAPRLVRFKEQSLCHVDDKWITAIGIGELKVLDRTGREVRTLRHPSFTPLPCSDSVRSRWIVVSNPEHPVLVDLELGTVRAFAGQIVFADVRRERIVYAKERTLVELDPATGAERTLVTTSSPIVVVGANGPWALLRTEANALVRIDLETGEHATTYSKFSTSTITRRGVVWLSDGRNLARWDGVLPAIQRHHFDSEVHWLYSLDDIVMLSLADLTVWAIDDRGARNIASNPYKRNRIGIHALVSVASPHSLSIRSLVTGETWIRRTGPIDSIGLHGMAISVRMAHWLAIYDDPVPLEPAPARMWIDRATNATLEPDSEELTWKLPHDEKDRVRGGDR